MALASVTQLQPSAFGLVVSDVVQRVRGAQLLLCTVSVPGAPGAFLVIPKMTQHPEFLVLAWVAAAATGLSPSWFFLGTERGRVMTLIQVASACSEPH